MITDQDIKEVHTDDHAISRTFHLEKYNRYVDLIATIFGGVRFCLTSEFNRYSYDLNWCMGKVDMVNQIFKAVLYALENNIKLPNCSDIKPIHNDHDFIDHIEKLTGVVLCEKTPYNKY